MVTKKVDKDDDEGDTDMDDITSLYKNPEGKCFSHLMIFKQFFFFKWFYGKSIENSILYVFTICYLLTIICFVYCIHSIFRFKHFEFIV